MSAPCVAEALAEVDAVDAILLAIHMLLPWTALNENLEKEAMHVACLEDEMGGATSAFKVKYFPIEPSLLDLC